MDLPDEKNIDRYIEGLKNSTHRMADLTHRLLAYARGGKYQPKTISMNDFVQDTVPLIQHSIDPAIRVEMYLPDDISNVEVDLTQMQMVLSAVLSNASEAAEGEGRIRISTRDEKIDEEFAITIPDLKPGLYVCLTIEDEGKGMDEETRSRVFDPFFTTKFQGRGLGMAAAYGIIKNHGGWISLDSELGKGTVVRICLPAVEVHVERAKETKAEATSGTGTILVIEDEDVVIDVIRTMLERLGYRILLARTGTHAVDIARTFDGNIDLAILDIVLPDIRGEQVYPLIMEARPNLKVIVCSGYTIDGPGQEILDAGAQDFIQKPFSFETLSKKLKEVLGGQTSN
jgi:two-component system cell cycle sensor histidine kinase/response regulator CckA